MKESKKVNSKMTLLLIFLQLIVLALIQVSAQEVKLNKYFIDADKKTIEGDYERAVIDYLRGLSKSKSLKRKKPVFIYDDLGFASLQIGDFKKAKQYLEWTIKAVPENYNPCFYLALIYFYSDQLDEALAELKKIEKDIYFNNSWFDNKKRFKKKNGKEIEKIELKRMRLEKGILVKHSIDGFNNVYIDSFDKNNLGAYYFTYGVILARLGDLDKAEEKMILARSVGYDEKDIKLELNNIVLARSGEKDLIAIPYAIRNKLNHKLKNYENSQLVVELNEKFFAIIKKGKIKEAIDVLEKALNINEISHPININLALAYFTLSKLENLNPVYLEKAEFYCARALWFKDFQKVKTSDVIDLYDLMGNIYYSQGKYKRSLQEFKQIINHDPINPLAHFDLGMAYHSLKDLEQAEHELLKAIEYENVKIEPKEKLLSEDERQHKVTVEVRPISFDAHMNLGLLYKEQNLNDKALIHFEKASVLDPDQPGPYYNLGIIYHIKREYKKALDCYNKYLYLGGKKEEIVNKLIKSLKR